MERLELCPLSAAGLEPAYRSLALVSRAEHLDLFDPADSSILVVACDWLVWQRAVNGGRVHCTYFELGLVDATDLVISNPDLLLRAADWAYDGNADVSMFKGASLARMVVADVSYCLISLIRIRRSLQGLIGRFSPSEIIYCDYRNEPNNVLDTSSRRDFVREVAGDHGIRFKDRSAEFPPDEQAQSSENPIVEGQPNLPRRILTRGFATLLQGISTVRGIADRRPRVLLSLNSNLLAPLLQAYGADSAIRPLVNAQSVPRTIKSFLHCLRLGVGLLDFSARRLEGHDIAEFASLQERIERKLSAEADWFGRTVATFVREHVLRSGRLLAAAEEVVSAQRRITRWKPTRVVLDGVKNRDVRALLDAATLAGVPVDYTWHSPTAFQILKFDGLGGDDRTTRRVSRCLSWGRANDAWFDALEARQPRVTVGSLVADRYRSTGERRQSAKRYNALILQYTAILTDLPSLSHSVFQNFVETVATLRRMGFVDVRMKLHPGPGRWRKSYFETVAESFHLDCAVYKTEPLAPLIAWADALLGPIHSGAFFESLAAGAPYVPFLMAPHGLDASCFGDYPIAGSAEEIPAVLERLGQADSARLLDDFYDDRGSGLNAHRFWSALGGGT